VATRHDTSARKKQADAPRTVHLPVLVKSLAQADRRLKRRRRIRACVLAGVWMLMIAHVTHWAITGRSVAPFVLSDAMKTLELGQINPGFLLFAAALLVTLVCGRFLCGWACHMGAMQDLCAWCMKKCGVRPRMFRSRLLGYVPLLLALYMFVWPTAKRIAILPVLEQVWPGGAAMLGPVAPFPGWSTKLMTTDLWAGLPTVAVAIPFLLLCGFATVYFLGARGLCRYGCPYGGFFLPAEQLAVGRVVVNPDLCDGCGRCTAACTAGVRVLEETKAFGMVVDRNCMRSLDCVAACPHDALRLGIARPAVLSRATTERPPRPSSDLSFSQEAGIAGLFAAGFFATRGLYGVIPLLLSVTLSAIAAFVIWRAWHLQTQRDARLVGVQLKRAGKVRAGGWALRGLAAATLVLIAHSATVQGAQWWGGVLDGRTMATREQVFGTDPAGVQQSDRATARQALWWYRWGRSIREGGIGLLRTREIEHREAWLLLVSQEHALAAAKLRGLIRADAPVDALVADLARVLLMLGDTAGARQELERACAIDSPLGDSRRLLGWVRLTQGEHAAAAASLQRAMDETTEDPATLDLLATAWAAAGEGRRAIDALVRLSKAGPDAAAYAKAKGVQLLDLLGSPDPEGEWRALVRASPGADREVRGPG
jgi:polyferredoxin